MDKSIEIKKTKEFTEKTRQFLLDVSKNPNLSHFAEPIREFFIQIMDFNYSEPEICYVTEDDIEMEWYSIGICKIIEIDVVRFVISLKNIEFPKDINVFHFELPEKKEEVSSVFLKKSIQTFLNVHL